MFITVSTCTHPLCFLLQMPEFHQRVGVLQQLGYVSADGTVTLKGRAACEINSTQVRLMRGGRVAGTWRLFGRWRWRLWEGWRQGVSTSTPGGAFGGVCLLFASRHTYLCPGKWRADTCLPSASATTHTHTCTHIHNKQHQRKQLAQDELLSTELLFRGLLTGMAPEEAVALMSALVFQVRAMFMRGAGGARDALDAWVQAHRSCVAL